MFLWYNINGGNVKKTIFVLFISLLLIGCGKNNKSIIYEFDSSPASGYTWSYEINDPNVVRINESFEIDDECEEDKKCSGTQIYEVVGIQKGKTEISFKYYNGREIKILKKYKIEVNDDLTLSEID